MTIAPIKRSVAVKVPPARAFDLFTSQMGQWWPKGRTIGAEPHTAIVVEPRVDGRWFERDESGHETPWGRVLAWEPPSRLLLGWQINRLASGKFGFDAGLLTEVEVRFAPADAGGTVVTLQHRQLERFGAEAAKLGEAISGGWSDRMADFARYADAG